MKKAIIGAGVLVAAITVLRRFGPALAGWAMRKCEGMWDRMPDEFPPKRMMQGIEDTREQSSRILALLDESQRSPAIISQRG